MEEQNIKLTKLTKCAGCGAKVGAGVLAQLLEGIRVHHDNNTTREGCQQSPVDGGTQVW